MGDPRKHRKKYQTPGHPWNSERIKEEKELHKEYGLKNKREIWKMETVMRNAKAQAKKLSRTRTEQARIEEIALLTKLKALGMLPEDANLNTILSVGVKDILERRLQTRLYKQMLANSMKQARQYIVHGHVTVDDKCITSPAYLVSLKEESLITFHPECALADPEHPERVVAKKETPEEVELKARAKDKEKAAEKKTEKKEDKKEAKKKKAKPEVKKESAEPIPTEEKKKESKEEAKTSAESAG